jgi:hypothetical protein
VRPGEASDGLPVISGHDGDGQDRVRFVRNLAEHNCGPA